MVEQDVLPGHSKMIQDGSQDKPARLEGSCLAVECAKLDPKVEQVLADDGLPEELDAWPAY